METYETIKNILAEGGKCLLIENDKPLGVVLTIDDYNNLKKVPATAAPLANKTDVPKTLEQEINPILNEEILSEFNFDEAARAANASFSDELTLEDLGLEEELY